MAFSFNDPIIQLGLFICADIIVTGVCTYFGYSSDQYGIYMAFTAFILSVVMILPDPIQIGNGYQKIVAPNAVISVVNAHAVVDAPVVKPFNRKPFNDISDVVTDIDL